MQVVFENGQLISLNIAIDGWLSLKVIFKLFILQCFKETNLENYLFYDALGKQCPDELFYFLTDSSCVTGVV